VIIESNNVPHSFLIEKYTASGLDDQIVQKGWFERILSTGFDNAAIYLLFGVICLTLVFIIWTIQSEKKSKEDIRK